MATHATSIESDSLNPVDEEVGTKQLLRTKSVDNLIGDVDEVGTTKNTNDAPTATDDCSQEMRGSTDSGLYRQMERQRDALVRENEEACRRFFEDDQDGVLKIDERSSMEVIMREIIEMMRIRFLIIYFSLKLFEMFLFSFIQKRFMGSQPQQLIPSDILARKRRAMRRYNPLSQQFRHRTERGFVNRHHSVHIVQRSSSF